MAPQHPVAASRKRHRSSTHVRSKLVSGIVTDAVRDKVAELRLMEYTSLQSCLEDKQLADEVGQLLRNTHAWLGQGFGLLAVCAHVDCSAVMAGKMGSQKDGRPLTAVTTAGSCSNFCSCTALLPALFAPAQGLDGAGCEGTE